MYPIFLMETRPTWLLWVEVVLPALRRDGDKVLKVSMAKALVVVESPAKAKTINKYLGRNYKVMASMGHVRDLPKSKLGVDIDDDFEPSYEVIASRKKVLKANQR